MALTPAPVGGVYLTAYLAPLAPFLAGEDVTDLFVNRPGELWIEKRGGGLQRHDIPEIDDVWLWRLARQIASVSHQGVSRAHPLLAASLPDGARVQIVAPPAARLGLALAIRKHGVEPRLLSDYVAGPDEAGGGLAVDGRLEALRRDISAGRWAEGLAAAVQGRMNIVVSGGTSTGKTTFLNTLLGHVAAQERLILIEDAPEVRLTHANMIGLVAVKGDQGEARITTDDLLQAALRMRPDRILLGELRGTEAYTFLRAVNTGHPGSMTTLHADSPQGALRQLALMVMQGGGPLRLDDILEYARSVIDVIVQLERRNGRRRIAAIEVRT